MGISYVRNIRKKSFMREKTPIANTNQFFPYQKQLKTNCFASGIKIFILFRNIFPTLKKKIVKNIKMHLLTNYDFVTDRWTFTVKYLQDKFFRWYCRMNANEFDLATKWERKKTNLLFYIWNARIHILQMSMQTFLFAHLLFA